MQTKDQTTQPDRLAARMPTAAQDSEPDATATTQPLPLRTQPLPPRTTPVIGTPIVSVASTPARPAGANGIDLYANPPVGVVEGVTVVEPRADPGNDSELESVILSPAVTAELAAREAEARSATTVRTRSRRRGNADADAQANPAATRRSATLLAMLVAIALLLTGVSAIFRNATSASEPAEADKPVAQPQARENERVDVQAATPQAEAEPKPASPPLDSTQAKLDAAALLPPPDAAKAPGLQASESEAEPEVVSVRSHDSTSKVRAARAPSQARSPGNSGTSTGETHASTRADPYAASTPSTAVHGEGKSWIKVRE